MLFWCFGLKEQYNNILYMLLNLKKGEVNMPKNTISDNWGFSQPADKEKSESAINSCPNIICLVGNCVESSMQFELKFDKPATEFKFEIMKY